MLTYKTSKAGELYSQKPYEYIGDRMLYGFVMTALTKLRFPLVSKVATVRPRYRLHLALNAAH
jgi:hypothetical protein